MRITLAVAITLLSGMSAAAQTSGGQQQQQTDPPKKEQKAAPSIDGKWTITTVTQNGPIVSTMVLKVEGKKLTGTIASPERGEAAIAGEYADGKIAFSISMQTSNGAIDIAFSGAVKENGTMAGTLDIGAGNTLEWTAERAKG
jgi:hypothetical protein